MHRLLMCLMLALALPLYAQEQESGESDKSDTEQTETAEDDSELDEQGYATENEDDFEASQDVAADQSVAYPVDI